MKLTLGGFVEGVSIYRSRNVTADIPTPWNAIPLPNSPNYHLSEVRGSARQSRLSLLAEGAVDKDTALAAYFESDFLAAGASANWLESNSYSPRLRHGFVEMQGGLPIVVDGEVIGAIGASFDAPEHDVEIAQAGLVALGR